MTLEQAEIRARRAITRKHFGAVFDDLAALLFRHDPIGIAFVNNDHVQDNPDEYEPEVETILPRLKDCSSETECQKVIHEEFCRWFSIESAGSISDYESIANETWKLWNEQKLNCTKPELD